MEHSKRNVTFADIPKWLRKIILIISIILTILISDYFFDTKDHVMIACEKSKTIQKYDVLRLGCAVSVLDWWAIDEILSEMDIEFLDEYFRII